MKSGISDIHIHFLYSVQTVQSQTNIAQNLHIVQNLIN